MLRQKHSGASSIFWTAKPLEPVSQVDSLIGTVKGVVAIDGKAMRGARQKLHVLSAYAHAAGLVIGQRCVDGKSNEITAYRNFWKHWRLTEPLSRLTRWEHKKSSRRPF